MQRRASVAHVAKVGAASKGDVLRHLVRLLVVRRGTVVPYPQRGRLEQPRERRRGAHVEVDKVPLDDVGASGRERRAGEAVEDARDERRKCCGRGSAHAVFEDGSTRDDCEQTEPGSV